MAVYYKFKSARNYDSIPINGLFISVGTLKERIFESKRLGVGTDFDLVITNAQSSEEYLDEATLIPKNTSVLVRRLPGLTRPPIVTKQEPTEESKVVKTEPEKSNLPAVYISATKYPEDTDWDDFGDDMYATPNVLPVQSSNLVPEAPSTNKDDDEDSKIKALVNTPALDWQSQDFDGSGPRRGFGRIVSRQGMVQKTPPQGYVCHRCKVPGHFIQHCPTNGDPKYDVKRVKLPTGIPRSMLMPSQNGSYVLPSGDVAVLKPNEAVFEKEIEGLPSSCSSSDLPPELHCPLCNDVMKYAVITSKCCFKSFCDKCMRAHIISKSMCVCGAKNILADDLLPNKTLRDTISRMVEGVSASSENAGSTLKVVPDPDSVLYPQSEFSSLTSSAVSSGEQNVAPADEETTKTKEEADDNKAISVPQQKSEATHDSMSVKGQTSQVKQTLSPGATGKKKKKVSLPIIGNSASVSHVGVENYMMPMVPTPGYIPYWNDMQPLMEGFFPQYGVLPQDQFYMQRYVLPVVQPQRDFSKHRDYGRQVRCGGDVSLIKSKHEMEAPRSAKRKWEQFQDEDRVGAPISYDIHMRE